MEPIPKILNFIKSPVFFFKFFMKFPVCVFQTIYMLSLICMQFFSFNSQKISTGF